MSATTTLWVCLGLSLLWLVAGVTLATRDERGVFYTNSSVFLAASFVIGALS